MAEAKELNRRSFMVKSGAVVAGATVCSGCSLFTRQAKPDVQTAATAGVMTLSQEDSAKVAEPGTTLRLASPDGETRIFLVRGQNGQLTALSMVCTHWGSDVDYLPGKEHLVCPSHGSRFGLDGRVLEGPAGDALTRYAVDESESVIKITL